MLQSRYVGGRGHYTAPTNETRTGAAGPESKRRVPEDGSQSSNIKKMQAASTRRSRAAGGVSKSTCLRSSQLAPPHHTRWRNVKVGRARQALGDARMEMGCVLILHFVPRRYL